MIQRITTSQIKDKLFKGKVILLMGARQVGKTSILKGLFHNNENVLWLNADEKDVRDLFETLSAKRFEAYLGVKTILVIDEAQRISDIGLKIKLLHDSLPKLQIVATGSSSFELANKVNEPLTGRKWEFKLYPLSFAEMVKQNGLLDEQRLIAHRLVFGYYPDVVTHQGDEIDVLKQLSYSYLYRDILMWDQIQKPDKLIKLLQALALQVGSQVSYNEIGQICGLDSKTVDKYIQILEQTYVIFRLPSFNRNMRNELKQSKKIYFYDNGIRNAIINNFNHFESRNDIGLLWENFVISERIKHLNYNKIYSNQWFWRTKEQKEIDWIEERDGQLFAFEFKWNPKQKTSVPKSFLNAYPNSNFEVIHQENIIDFIL